jgi:hypothetical protein
MSTHSHIQQQLYDYAKGELDLQVMEQINQHISSCPSCRQELSDLELFFERIGSETQKACDTRSQEFWNDFADSTMERIQSSEYAAKKSSPGFWEGIIDSIFPYRVPALGLAGVMAVAILLLIFWPQPPSGKPTIVAEQLVAVDTPVTTINKQFESYLRKSKTLLIGVTNMDLKNDQPIDFAAEQKASYELVSEARSLQKQRPVMMHSGQLLGDLEKIQIELAAIDPTNPGPRIELIRQGIREDNLLFKIRMAESVYGHARFMSAKGAAPGGKK